MTHPPELISAAVATRILPGCARMRDCCGGVQKAFTCVRSFLAYCRIENLRSRVRTDGIRRQMTDTGTQAGGRSIEAAQTLAARLLDRLPERLSHSAAVAARAEAISSGVPDDDKELLVAAAWLHDIGYAEPIAVTGFHPLDGGLYLRAVGWPERLCGLVAHHSGARFAAKVRGLADRLEQFPFERCAVSDALTFADQTVGPGGQRMTIDERLADVIERHGPDSPNARANPLREPYIRGAAKRAIARMPRVKATALEGLITNETGANSSILVDHS